MTTLKDHKSTFCNSKLQSIDHINATAKTSTKHKTATNEGKNLSTLKPKNQEPCLQLHSFEELGTFTSFPP